MDACRPADWKMRCHLLVLDPYSLYEHLVGHDDWFWRLQRLRCVQTYGSAVRLGSLSRYVILVHFMLSQRLYHTLTHCFLQLDPNSLSKHSSCTTAANSLLRTPHLSCLQPSPAEHSRVSSFRTCHGQFNSGTTSLWKDSCVCSASSSSTRPAGPDLASLSGPFCPRQVSSEGWPCTPSRNESHPMRRSLKQLAGHSCLLSLGQAQ